MAQEIIYFNCFAGISGDMILGALLDAGFDLNYLKNELNKLKLTGCEILAKKVKKNNIAGTKFEVVINKNVQKQRNYIDIIRMIEKSKLKEEIKKNSKKIFLKIAEAESKVHNIKLNEIHFHEIGAIDSIIDIVGSCIAFDFFKEYKIFSSFLNLGSGIIKTSHGFLPVPAPATSDLLKGIPVYLDIPQKIKSAELTTPTGAAIISTFCTNFGEMPIMEIEKIGYGAGSKELNEFPNLLQVFLGKMNSRYEMDIVTVIETNIDDASPIIYENLVSKLLKEGCMDVFITPVLMKKTRPAVLLTAIAEKQNVEKVIDTIFSETTTFGIRTYEVTRKKLKREIKKINTKFGKLRVKIGYIGNKKVKITPEYEDCLKISEEKKIPLQKILKEIQSKFYPLK